MNPFNPEQFEAELRRLRPALPPRSVLARTAAELAALPAGVAGGTQPAGPSWIRSMLLRWLVPAGVVTALCAGLYLKNQGTTPPMPGQARLAAARPPVLKADKIEIDRQLVADFDAVAKLPSGEPVRFRCEQWMDKVQWRDSRKGLVVEQTTPRLEIVPVRFETY